MNKKRVISKMKNIRFFRLIMFSAMLFTVLTVPLFAEPDNGRFLPEKEQFSAGNMYVSLEPAKMQIPLSFARFGITSMTKLGYGLAGEIGYNWDGWLIGLSSGYSGFGRGVGDYSLMENFNTISIGPRISRVLSSRTLKFLPDWLELVPVVGFGANFFKTDYYKSKRAKDENRMTHVGYGDVVVMYAQLGLHADFYLGTDWAIPYAGIEYNMFVDRIGLASLPNITIGVRSYPFRFFEKNKKAEKKTAGAEKQPEKKPEPQAEPQPKPQTEEPSGPPSLKITVETQDFTPDGDGVNDKAVFNVQTSSLDDSYTGWTITILDPKGAVFKVMEGKGLPPEKLTWNGYSDEGIHVESALVYPLTMQLLSEDSEKNLSSESSIETGILVDRLIDGNLRIRIVSIFFDPSAATFNVITEEQKLANKRTLDKIAQQIGRFPEYNLVIEGHANNTSGTEDENIKFLLPLSKERAEVISAELVRRGIPADRMSTVGLGGNFPIVPREDKEGWWRNRRVEFLLKKN
ncbi:MAG: hypothetical protein CSA76_04680 [Spirochaetales bacterium]|nr:MAG: hypothetical protein CSA76_04680 [Spirochaetales bacterium]